MCKAESCSSCIYSESCGAGSVCNSYISRESILDDFVDRSLAEIDRAEYAEAYLEYIDEDSE